MTCRFLTEILKKEERMPKLKAAAVPEREGERPRQRHGAERTHVMHGRLCTVGEAAGCLSFPLEWDDV